MTPENIEIGQEVYLHYFDNSSYINNFTTRTGVITQITPDKSCIYTEFDSENFIFYKDSENDFYRSKMSGSKYGKLYFNKDFLIIDKKKEELIRKIYNLFGFVDLNKLRYDELKSIYDILKGEER